MRNLNNLDVHMYRDRKSELAIYGMAGDEGNGVFNVEIVSAIRPKVTLHVIAANGMGWDHVSVSHRHRIPKWDEMSFVHRLFFKANETAMQLHVPLTQHINVHDHCLHLWRPQDEVIPAPPGMMVG